MRIIFFLFLCGLHIWLTGCVSQKTITGQEVTKTAPTEELPSAFELEAEKILGLIENGEFTLANYQLQALDQQATTAEDGVLLAYTRARLYISQENIEAAYLTLQEESLSEQTLLVDNPLQLKIGLLKAQVLQQKEKYIDAAELRAFLSPLIDEQASYYENHFAIWSNLALLTAEQVNLALENRPPGEFQQWLSLSKIVLHGDMVLDQQIAAINGWQNLHPAHPAALIPLPEIAAIRTAVNQKPANIAIILPFDSKYRSIAEAIRDGFMHAFYKTLNRPKLNFYSIDESQSFVSIYNEAIYDGADMVIGPLFKGQLEELYTLGTLPVTTIALNKLDRIDKPINLYEYSLSTEDEILSLIELASQENHQNAVVISQEDSKSEKNIETFTDNWLALGNNVLNTSTFKTTREQSKVVQSLLNIDKSNQRIREMQWLLGTNVHHEPRRRKDIDMIMMFAKSESATSLRPLLAFHYASTIPIYASSTVYRGYPDQAVDADLNGIRFTDIPLTLYYRDKVIQKYRNSSLIRMYAFGIDAFQLSERIKLMEGIPEHKLYGATGRFTLNRGQLQRQTSFALFSQGLAKPLPVVATQ